jgi:hypothetical protein
MHDYLGGCTDLLVGLTMAVPQVNCLAMHLHVNVPFPRRTRLLPLPQVPLQELLKCISKVTAGMDIGWNTCSWVCVKNLSGPRA